MTTGFSSSLLLLSSLDDEAGFLATGFFAGVTGFLTTGFSSSLLLLSSLDEVSAFAGFFDFCSKPTTDNK